MSLSSVKKKSVIEASDFHSSTTFNDHVATVPIIGYSAEELEIARNSAFWKPVRYTLFLLFWLLWAGFLAGTTVIVVMNNGDVSTTVTPATTAGVKKI